MQTSELNRAVAHATGESLSTIRRLGFGLAEPFHDHDPEPYDTGPHAIDWDELESERFQQSYWGIRDEPAAA